MTIIKQLTGLAAGVALAFGSTAASASSALSLCAGGQAGCVLPTGAVAAPMDTTTTTTAVDPVLEETGGGIGALGIIAALAAAGLLAYFLLDDDDDSASA